MTKLRACAADLLPPLLAGMVLVLAYMALRAQLEPHRLFLMPSLDGLWSQAFSRPDVLTALAQAAAMTLAIALAGLCISIPAGMVLGIVMFRLRALERAILPYLVALQSLPVLAIVPLLQTAFGYGVLPKVLVVALFTFFAIPTTLLLGLKSMDRGVLDLFRLQRANWLVTLWKAGLPSAAPTLFAGLRLSASLAVIGAIVSELFFMSGSGGLGQMLVNTKLDFKYEQMYAALIAASLLSILVHAAFGWLGNCLFAHWHESGGPARAAPLKGLAS